MFLPEDHGKLHKHIVIHRETTKKKIIQSIALKNTIKNQDELIKMFK